MGMTLVPWLFKPLLAFISDENPIRGRRRTPYLAGGALLIAGACAGVATARSYGGVVALLAVNTLGRSLLTAVLQGMVVEAAQLQGEDSSSKMVGDFFFVKTGGALLSTFLSSLLVAELGPRAVVGCVAGLPLFLIGAIARYEARAPAGQPRPAEPSHASAVRWEALLQTVQNPAIWGSLAFLVLYNSGPNYDDSLYYWYINRLGFQPTAIGKLKMAQEAAKLAGVVAYRFWLRRIPDDRLTIGATCVSFPLYMMPLLLTTGVYKSLHIDPQMLAISGELVREVFLHLQVLPAFARWVQLCPAGLEGTAVSLLVATLQVSRAVSKASSAGAAAVLGVTQNNFANLSTLIVVCGGFCLLPLSLAPLLPSGGKQDTELGSPMDEGLIETPVMLHTADHQSRHAQEGFLHEPEEELQGPDVQAS